MFVFARACGGPRFMSGLAHYCSSTVFLEAAYESNPGLTDMARLLASLFWGSQCSAVRS